MLRVWILEYDGALSAPHLCRGNLDAVLRQPIAPVVVTSRWDGEIDLHAKTDAQTSVRRMTEREERQIGAGMSVRVGVKQVIGPRIVLVDAPLHEPHAEHLRVELQVLLRVAGYGGDVMDACDFGHV
jgi:hypothetical protein